MLTPVKAAQKWDLITSRIDLKTSLARHQQQPNSSKTNDIEKQRPWCNCRRSSQSATWAQAHDKPVQPRTDDTPEISDLQPRQIPCRAMTNREHKDFRRIFKQTRLDQRRERASSKEHVLYQHVLYDVGLYLVFFLDLTTQDIVLCLLRSRFVLTISGSQS